VLAGSAFVALSAAARAGRPTTDLRIATVINPPSALTAGGSFDAVATVRSTGRPAGRHVVALYLSVDGRRDKGDQRLTGSLVPARAIGRLAVAAGRVTVPAGASGGTFRLLACADDPARVRETSETNNCTASRRATTLAAAGAAAATVTIPGPTVTIPGPPLTIPGPPVTVTAPGETTTTTVTGAASTVTVTTEGPSVTTPGPTTTVTAADTTSPGAPVLLSTAPGSPSRTSTTPEVVGSSEPGSSVQVFTSSDCTGTAAATSTAGSSGGFRATVGVPANATSALSASARDAAGNASACSQPLSFRHDALPPAAPQLTAASPASPGRERRPGILGTAEPGATVTLFLNADCSGTPAATGTAEGLAGSGIGVLVPVDADSAVRARATDAAGNGSGCSSPLAYTEDETPPPEPGIGFFPGGGQVFDAYSTDPRPTLRVFRVSTDGTSIRAFANGACGGTPLATVPAAPNGEPTDFLVDATNNGEKEFSADVVDAAGNVGPCSFERTYRHDTVRPQPPIIMGFTPVGAANDNNPEIWGILDNTNAENVESISLTSTLECLGSAAIVKAFDFEAPGRGLTVPVADGLTKTVTARAIDSAGNVSPCSDAVSYTEDSTLPNGEEIESNGSAASATTNAGAPPATRVLLSNGGMYRGTNGGFDADFYKADFQPTDVVRAEVWDNTGRDCELQIIPRLGLADSTGTVPLGRQASVNTAAANCSGMTVAWGATRFVKVASTSSTASVTPYSVSTVIVPDVGNESEQNATTASADPIAPGFIDADHSDALDVDVFAVTLTERRSLRAEVIESASAADTCNGTGTSRLDARLELLAANGTVLESAEDGRSFCPAIDGRGKRAFSALRDNGATDLDPGTYFLRVTAGTGASTDASQFAYRLVLVTQ
jgi:hypothetical protein